MRDLRGRRRHFQKELTDPVPTATLYATGEICASDGGGFPALSDASDARARALARERSRRWYAKNQAAIRARRNRETTVRRKTVSRRP